MSFPIRKALYGAMAGDGGVGGLVYHEGLPDGLLGTPAAGYTHSIYYGSAPRRADFPLVIMQKQSGTPTYGRGFAPTATAAQGPLLESDLWLIKAVNVDPTIDDDVPLTPVSAIKRAETIATRIDRVLTNTALSIAAPTVNYFLARESDMDFSEVVDGRDYYHVGSFYRVEYL